jgi:hypothetical protein
MFSTLKALGLLPESSRKYDHYTQGWINFANFGRIFFQRAPKKKGQKGQLKVQNSSADVFADEKKKNGNK